MASVEKDPGTMRMLGFEEAMVAVDSRYSSLEGDKQLEVE